MQNHTINNKNDSIMAKYTYYNRDLSWLSFNYRVLQEAKDTSIPLYERIKFLAIFSNNLEEFYQVRVSYYRQLIKNKELMPPRNSEKNPLKTLHKINETVNMHQSEFQEIFYETIVSDLKKQGIFLLEKDSELTQAQEIYLEKIFNLKILSTIQPILLVKHKIFPFLKTGQVYLVMELYSKDSKASSLDKRIPKYGIIKLPTDHNISRFISLPPEQNKYSIVFLDDVIMRFVDKIFPGYEIKTWSSIKLTRDADLDFDEYEGEELINAISSIGASRTLGEPNRFLHYKNISPRMLKYLVETLEIDNSIIVKGGTHHNFRDFFTFPNPFSPKLEYEKLSRIRISDFDNSPSIAKCVNNKDYLLNVPYQTYDHFIRFLRETTRDESVSEILLTQYRVAPNSEVVSALIEAAENGKKVIVFVELKARFDEEANLLYANEMMRAGIKIIYSIPNLKVHAKVALIIRKPDSKFKSQAFLGTGNFNEKTARLYGDHGLFTSHKGIIKDLIKLFAHLENQTVKMNYKHILVPNYNMIETFSKLIDNEIAISKRGGNGYILLKMNGLQDPAMVDKLYKASEKGVKIDLLIRGVCILKTGKKYSKNIRVIRIIDRFLEHARVFVFNNADNPIIYLGSADWMKRNLYRRIECDFPVYDDNLKQEIIDILKLQLNDNVTACLVAEKMTNVRIKNDKPLIRSQSATYEYLKEKYQ